MGRGQTCPHARGFRTDPNERWSFRQCCEANGSHREPWKRGLVRNLVTGSAAGRSRHIWGGSNVLPVAFDDDRYGRVVILNGGSSAGKTTLGRKLQSSLAGSWLLLGVDLFIWTLPAEMIAAPGGLLRYEGVITRGSRYMWLWRGFQMAVGALARSGVDVLLDDVMLEGSVDQRRWDDALHDVDVYWVGLRCTPETAAAREAERGDRPIGIARHQAVSVHEGMRYDQELDTGVLGVSQSVDAVARVSESLCKRRNT